MAAAREMRNRAVVVTGAAGGLGSALADRYAALGARLALLDLDAARGEALAQRLRAGGAQAWALACDLADEAACSAAIADAQRTLGGIDLLVNNAGVMAPPRRETADGFELQLGTNHLGHFALTGLLFDQLKKKRGSRVVTVSSNAHKMGKIDFEDLQSNQNYRRWNVYGQSKLANLIFAIDLQKRIDETRLDMASMAAHPGLASTNLGSAGTGAGNGVVNLLTTPFLMFSNAFLAQDAEHGALPTLFAAVSPGLAGGSYVGPDGVGELRGSPTIVAPRRVAHNHDVAERLWNASVELTGVEYDFSTP